MAYSLTDARTALKRSVLWRTERAVFEKLIGLSDGENRVFRTKGKPVSDLTLYQAGGSAPWVPSYTLHADDGVLVFDAAPSTIPLATYETVEYTDAQLLDVCKDGFEKMQRVYRRAYYLVDDGGSTYVSSDPDSVVDPVISGDIEFSESPVQMGLLHLCSLYCLVRFTRFHSGRVGILFRESMSGGAMLDIRGRARDLKDLEQDIDEDIKAATESAEEEISGTSAWGAYMPGARSDDYESNFEWWEGSDQEQGVID